MTQPIFYSFRRCPYAMRARLSLIYAQQSVTLREVVLQDKPQALLDINPEATVPVLQLADGTVITESQDIMLWALQRNDPVSLLSGVAEWSEIESLMNNNDGEFKFWLDRYKYSDRYDIREYIENDENVNESGKQLYFRQQAEVFIVHLEQCLSRHAFLLGEQVCLADIAIMPFVRQFAAVDSAWFETSKYEAVRSWLNRWLAAPAFLQLMTKYPAWQAGQQPVTFPESFKL